MSISTLFSYLHASELDVIIPAEIKNDAFYNAIYKLARTEALSTVLEIGSSSGEGSTEAFVRGVSENPSHPTLFCMEVSKTRFTALQQRYQHTPAVRCYNVSSIPIDAFPQPSEVRSFYNSVRTNLNMYELDRVLGWLQQDINYVKNANVPQTGIELIKKENGINHFDMVLIDGSEFSGRAEFNIIYGAKFILLDDTNAFKNYFNYKQLLSDPNYVLIEEDQQLRNGYAIFKKK